MVCNDAYTKAKLESTTYNPAEHEIWVEDIKPVKALFKLLVCYRNSPEAHDFIRWRVQKSRIEVSKICDKPRNKMLWKH